LTAAFPLDHTKHKNTFYHHKLDILTITIAKVLECKLRNLSPYYIKTHLIINEIQEFTASKIISSLNTFKIMMI